MPKDKYYDELVEVTIPRKIAIKLKHILAQNPDADVEDVVRCEGCRFNVSNMEKDGFDTTDYSGEDIVCSYFLTDGMLPDDFCSYGERDENK